LGISISQNIKTLSQYSAHSSQCGANPLEVDDAIAFEPEQTPFNEGDFWPTTACCRLSSATLHEFGPRQRPGDGVISSLAVSG
jgi:hypothetical protein